MKGESLLSLKAKQSAYQHLFGLNYLRFVSCLSKKCKMTSCSCAEGMYFGQEQGLSGAGLALC